MSASSPARVLSVESPRSRRVGMAGPPPNFNLGNFQNVKCDPTSPSSLSSPPVPIRSPLRPSSRSISSGNLDCWTEQSGTTPLITKSQGHREPTTPPPLQIDDTASIVDESLLSPFQLHQQAILALSVALEDSEMPKVKALPLRPESPVALSPEDEATSSTSSLIPAASMPVTKRQHALRELLSSERAYASDLALIRAIHIPLAMGLSPHTLSSSSPPSLSSSRVSSLSDSSAGPSGPPMSPDDIRTVFSNVDELAVFADEFVEALEEALGSVIDGGTGEDCVGSLFLKIIPEMEQPYKYYITRHGSALSHLQGLPQTPALTAYFAQTKAAASSLTHAWDLASLLIKPVQRLLKYPLLLATIIDETPDTHPDKENLKQARLKLEEVARNVNEGRRRAEVVKEVLSAKKKPVNVAVSASVNLGRMKPNRKGLLAGADANGEAAQVERMEGELKLIENFAQQFAKHVVEWAKSMGQVVRMLRVWTISFGKVIGLGPTQNSEAFDAFVAVIEQQLMPLCVRLEEDVTGRLMREIAHLLATIEKPRKLLNSMNDQEPLHYHLLTMNVSAKNRPSPALLAASTNYLALRGQLAAELPSYLTLLHKGISIFIRKLAHIQAEFWGDVRDRWGDLWEMLRVEGEINAGHAETLSVWRARWADVDELISSLNINQSRKLFQDPPLRPASHSQQVISALASLDPVFMAGSSPQLSTPPSKTRARGSSDSSISPPTPQPVRKGITKPPSQDNLYYVNGKQDKSKLQKKRPEDQLDGVVAGPVITMRVITPTTTPPHHLGSIPRTKSMPLPSEYPISPRSSSSSKTLVAGEQDSPAYSQETVHDDTGDKRGRIIRKASFKRKFAGTLRQRSGSRSNRTSNTSFDGYQPPDSPNQPPPPMPLLPPRNQFRNNNRDSWVVREAKYECKVIHSCRPPASVSYFSFPFFTLQEGDIYEVLQEAGHPSIHPKLPIYVDDGEDCLFLCRDKERNVGWALASFLAPIQPESPVSTQGSPPLPPWCSPGSSYRDSWTMKPAKYRCQVVHPCRPPTTVSYHNFPFFTLLEGDAYEVLHEAGHPSTHPKLPLYVDDGEDCLLFCRDEKGSAGWALASFLAPLSDS